MKDMDAPVIAAPARGRRPLDGPAPATPDIVSDQTTRAYVDELRQDTAVMPKAQLAQSLRVAEAAGMITAFQYNETANRVAMLKLFAQIRDSKVQGRPRHRQGQRRDRDRHYLGGVLQRLRL